MPPLLSQLFLPPLHLPQQLWHYAPYPSWTPSSPETDFETGTGGAGTENEVELRLTVPFLVFLSARGGQLVLRDSKHIQLICTTYQKVYTLYL